MTVNFTNDSRAIGYIATDIHVVWEVTRHRGRIANTSVRVQVNNGAVFVLVGIGKLADLLAKGTGCITRARLSWSGCSRILRRGRSCRPRISGSQGPQAVPHRWPPSVNRDALHWNNV